MALTLQLQNSIVNYTSLNLSDVSGDYNNPDNLTGWGSPNITFNDVDYAHLIVSFNSNPLCDIDITADLGIVFDGSTVKEDLVYNLPYTLLYNQSTNSILPDGIWTIEYRISTNSTWTGVSAPTTDFSITVNVMTYYTIQESVYNKIKLIPQYYTCSDCNNQFVKETMVIWAYLQALIASTQYANTVRFTEILSGLQDILTFDSSNCSSCGC